MRVTRVVAGVVAICAGLFLIVTSLWIGGFRAAAAGERLLDNTRGELSDEGLRGLRHDFEQSKIATNSLLDEVIPALAPRLGMTAPQLLQTLHDRYPAVDKALNEREEITAFTEKAISNLERHQDDYESADSLPVWFLPLTVAPGISVFLGLVLLALGVAVLWRPTGRGSLVALLLVGVFLVAYPLATRLPQRTSDAQDLIDALDITPQSAIVTRALFEDSLAFTNQISNEVVPDVAQALGVTPDALRAEVGRQVPAFAASGGDVGSFLRRFEVDVKVREEGFDEFATIRDVPTPVIPWLSIGAGLLVAITAALALATRREPGPEAPIVPEDAPERSPELVG